ncbi:nitrate- and nitrite sensing domain-containing protein [Actinomycetes bacterium KLBMP 9797]
MSTGPTTLPESGVQARGAARRFLPRLRDTKIRSKLALILLVPIVAIVALAGVRLADSAQRAADAGLIRSLTRLSADVSTLAHETHNERMAAARFLATANPTGGATPFTQQVQKTDAQVASYNRDRSELGDVPPAVEERLVQIDDYLRVLDETRQDVLTRKHRSPAEAVLRYTGIIGVLVSYPEVVGQIAGQGQLADSLRAAAAFAKLKAAVGDEQAVTYAALIGDGTLDREQYSAFVATLASQQEALEAFNLTADAWQQATVGAAVSGDGVELADRVANQVAQSLSANAPALNANEAASAIGAVANLMRYAETRLAADLIADADVVRADVVRQTLLESLLVLITLAIAVALAVVLARSLNQSLRRLREGALAVANRDLPEAVAKLRDVRSLGEAGPDEVVRQVRDAIRLPNRDEVGQVAQAFNVVHREAVRIAAEQAALRTSVSAMFLNLARRSQALVDRMIGELDMIERGEEDPKRLAQLFQLDHLATRMRRNDENLLVLAGADSTPPRRDDALLVDVLRAAQSEVELYNRIEFGTVDTDISVAAHAVNDVVRLLAELLDNATRFSPPNTVVVADARRIRDYVLLQVEDRGLGLTEEQLDALNRRLSQPPTVDVAAFRLMGLAVVGRLASRYGIRVELRPNVEGGTVAQVTLPSGIIVLPKPRTRENVLTRPRSPLAVEPSPISGAPVSTGGLPPQSALSALGARSAAATLSDPRPGNGNGARQDWNSTTVPVNAGAATNAFPTLGQQAAQGGLGTPTMAYPTVQPTSVPAVPATPMTPAMLPPAGLPAGPVAGPAAARATDVSEAPIYREMEAVWFRSHGQTATAPTEIFTVPADGYAAPPPRVAPPAPAPTPAPVAVPPPPAPVSTPVMSTMTTSVDTSPVPRQRLSTEEDSWRTAADEGWKRAEQATQPTTAGTTRSGLPKRVPQAQLVPGGVEAKTGREHARRTPDEVRGLLSAYHRGVQRGRTAGKAPSNSTKETSG